MPLVTALLMPQVLSSTSEACNMLIAIDERLFDQYNGDLDNVQSAKNG